MWGCFRYCVTVTILSDRSLSLVVCWLCNPQKVPEYCVLHTEFYDCWQWEMLLWESYASFGYFLHMWAHLLLMCFACFYFNLWSIWIILYTGELNVWFLAGSLKLYLITCGLLDIQVGICLRWVFNCEYVLKWTDIQ